ncbi:uncharacterized protein [Nicotiana sylvestris]|uniref:uncharacterized protein n=1 Tax=Nicotiana sylvestris TaxID=4096 RepID=UPI00388C6690
MPEDDHHRLERFGRLQSLTFSGVEGENAQGFLDECQRLLRSEGILEASRVSFTTFQISGATLSWWEAYERHRPVGAAPLSWQQFSILFLEKYVLESHLEELCRQFKHLHQGNRSVTQYGMRFSELARHVVWLVTTDRERIKRFIDGLDFQLRLLMTRER